jgi:hypothetical protein
MERRAAAHDAAPDHDDICGIGWEHECSFLGMGSRDL